MQIQQHTTNTIEATPTHATAQAPTKADSNSPSEATSNSALNVDSNSSAPRLFENLAQTTIAERYPRLTCFAISVALLVTALIGEIEYLKGSGYFWRW